jgi:hypothetical protein
MSQTQFILYEFFKKASGPSEMNASWFEPGKKGDGARG